MRRRSSAGVAVSITSSVGWTAPQRRWPPRGSSLSEQAEHDVNVEAGLVVIADCNVANGAQTSTSLIHFDFLEASSPRNRTSPPSLVPRPPIAVSEAAETPCSRAKAEVEHSSPPSSSTTTRMSAEPSESINRLNFHVCSNQLGPRRERAHCALGPLLIWAFSRVVYGSAGGAGRGTGCEPPGSARSRRHSSAVAASAGMLCIAGEIGGLAPPL